MVDDLSPIQRLLAHSAFPQASVADKVPKSQVTNHQHGYDIRPPKQEDNEVPRRRSADSGRFFPPQVRGVTARAAASSRPWRQVAILAMVSIVALIGGSFALANRSIVWGNIALMIAVCCGASLGRGGRLRAGSRVNSKLYGN